MPNMRRMVSAVATQTHQPGGLSSPGPSLHSSCISYLFRSAHPLVIRFLDGGDDFQNGEFMWLFSQEPNLLKTSWGKNIEETAYFLPTFKKCRHIKCK